MKNYMDMSLEEYQNALASSEPTPGGGTAAAIALGHACALTQMVCNLTIGKDSWKEGWVHSQRANEIAKRITARSKELAQLDSDSFEQVMNCFKLPKASEEEKSHRRNMIRKTTLHAAEIPHETAILGMEVLHVLEDLAKFGNANAASDVGVASLLASAAVKGALFNVEINTNSLPSEMGLHLSEQIPTLRLECSKVSRLVMHAVHERIS